ncbi:MAG: hypothetical protein ACK5SI_01090, partial [Planctomycetia bacterium]
MVVDNSPKIVGHCVPNYRFPGFSISEDCLRTCSLLPRTLPSSLLDMRGHRLPFAGMCGNVVRELRKRTTCSSDWRSTSPRRPRAHRPRAEPGQVVETTWCVDACGSFSHSIDGRHGHRMGHDGAGGHNQFTARSAQSSDPEHNFTARNQPDSNWHRNDRTAEGGLSRRNRCNPVVAYTCVRQA